MLDSDIKDPDRGTAYYQKQKDLELRYDKCETMTESEKQELRAEWRGLSEKYDQKLPTVKKCVDHIDYVKNLIEIDCVGIGSDFDGGGGLVWSCRCK